MTGMLTIPMTRKDTPTGPLKKVFNYYLLIGLGPKNVRGKNLVRGRIWCSEKCLMHTGEEDLREARLQGGQWGR